MYFKISIFCNLFGIFYASYMDSEPNYVKPRLERNNIVNKGIWKRNKLKEDFEKSNFADFIFRPNSLDVDNLLQNNFDAFGDGFVQDGPSFSNYVERNKRSSNHNRKRRHRKNIIKKSKLKTDDIMDDDASIIKSKIITKLRPATVFNDYPYEVAILLASNTKREIKEPNKQYIGVKENVLAISNDTTNSPYEVNVKSILKNVADIKNAMNIENKTNSNNNINQGDMIKINFNDEINDTSNINNTSKVDRSILINRNDNVWHQSPTIPETNSFKIPSNSIEPKTNKPVTERGLIKVLSMLTKTFRKIMKHHDDIKKIHAKLNVLNDNFHKNFDLMNHKFQEFDLKYINVLNFNEKLALIEQKFNAREEHFVNKERELSKGLTEFENQQKKFLAQQKQFYNIQKLMLAQNEKINIKQNMISKTQSEISHRQNNFARILKKAKQVYIDRKSPNVKLNSVITKPKDHKVYTEKIIRTTTVEPKPTENIKINLLSIPPLNRIVNQDVSILNEKDEQPVDDLVYKYYFNNTFIDNLMKNKILTNVDATNTENTDIPRNAKIKRFEDSTPETTILLPLDKHQDISETIGKGLNRKRRWIHHHNKKPKSNHNRNSEKLIHTEKNKIAHQINDNAQNAIEGVDNNLVNLKTKDPFVKMVEIFCKEIGQSFNDQALKWCMEKTLRRLRITDLVTPVIDPQKFNPDTKVEPSYAVSPKLTPTSTAIIDKIDVTTVPAATTSWTAPPFIQTQVTTAATLPPKDNSKTNVFFPDNDELETNLKQYELDQDTEGNVYYEGSLHASDIVGDDDSDGFSDILPGMDSNSRLEMDPLAFDFQTKRRAFVRRINENIMRNIAG